jgi:hypothetical protein
MKAHKKAGTNGKSEEEIRFLSHFSKTDFRTGANSLLPSGTPETAPHQLHNYLEGA